jgi:hypothetical protein
MLADQAKVAIGHAYHSPTKFSNLKIYTENFIDV